MQNNFKIYSVIFLLLTSVANASHSKKNAIPKVDKGNWITVQDNNIDSLEIDQNVDVIINGNQKEQVKIYSPEVYAWHDNTTLHLQTKEFYDNSKVKHNVVLHDINSIKSITMHDSSKLAVKHANNKNKLKIQAYDSSSFKLDGYFNISNIYYQSSASSKLLWANSDKIDINMVNGMLEIAGVANILAARTYNQAKLNATGLIGKTIYVNASDTSVGSFYPEEFLYTQASDHSSVTYGNFKIQKTIMTNDRANCNFVDLGYKNKKS